ncbi:MAG: hypothetical protein ABQ298_01190, partial [Puniceicoccaceae bacterium]
MDIPHYAVLTGDIVGSRKLSTHELASLFEGVRGVWRCFAEHHGDAVMGEFDVFRGDGWQVALTQPALCLRAAVFLRAAFRAHSKKVDVDSRIGVGVGPVDRIVRERLSESNGLASHALYLVRQNEVWQGDCQSCGQDGAIVGNAPIGV